MKRSELGMTPSVFTKHSSKPLAVISEETKRRLRSLLFSIEVEQTVALFPLRVRGRTGGGEEVMVSVGSDECIMQLQTWMQCSNHRDAVSDTSPTP